MDVADGAVGVDGPVLVGAAVARSREGVLSSAGLLGIQAGVPVRTGGEPDVGIVIRPHLPELVRAALAWPLQKRLS